MTRTLRCVSFDPRLGDGRYSGVKPSMGFRPRGAPWVVSQTNRAKIICQIRADLLKWGCPSGTRKNIQVAHSQVRKPEPPTLGGLSCCNGIDRPHLPRKEYVDHTRGSWYSERMSQNGLGKHGCGRVLTRFTAGHTKRGDKRLIAHAQSRPLTGRTPTGGPLDDF